MPPPYFTPSARVSNDAVALVALLNAAHYLEIDVLATISSRLLAKSFQRVVTLNFLPDVLIARVVGDVDAR
jgi:hypothetical protein